MSTKPYPTFNALPLDPNGPHGNAWGLWGEEDELGTLNHLTDEVVAQAAHENFRTGQRTSLNWSMTGPSYPAFPRKLLQQNLINKAPLKHAHDDEWTFNSQCSSQWDGMRHYAYQQEKAYYMGRTAEDFAQSEIPNGIQHMAKRGIAGRAIFIDWYAWAQQHKPVGSIDAMSSHAVPFSEIIAALRFQGLNEKVFRPGDIIIIRFGYIYQYETMSLEKREKLSELYKTKKPENIGIKPSYELLKFLWDNKIAAIGGDSRSFEVWPCTEEKWHLHEWLLAGWGLPIGELFYLETLAELSGTLKRYTFFFSSSPMNASGPSPPIVPGGVASPPNAIAFF